MKRLPIFAYFPFLFILIAACSEPLRYDVVFENVGYFDGEKDHGVVNLAISGDTVAFVSSEKLQSDSIIDGEGKYLIPGLVNSHSHIWEEDHLKEGLPLGILTNIGQHASSVQRDAKLKELSKQPNFTHYYSSGFAATVPYGHPTQVSSNVIETINDSVSVEMWVNNRISEDVDHIKIVRHRDPFGPDRNAEPQATLPYDSIKKIIEIARDNGLKTIVHAGSREEVLTIAEFKPSGFAHMWQYIEEDSLTDEMLAVLKNSDVFIIPTIIFPFRLAELQDTKDSIMLIQDKEDQAYYINCLKKVYEAGNPIVAGTDNGNMNINWGDDLFVELKLYLRAGMSPIESLKTATGNAAKAWDIPMGMLKVGSTANMVLVKGNPTKNLDDLRNVEGVWKADLSRINE